MARGTDTSNHAGRLVGRERWTQGAGNVTSMAGTLHSSAADLTEHGTGQTYETWQDRQGKYSAEVQHIEPVVGGQDFTTYGAGPFRTPARAQVAAEALGARAYTGKADPYRQGTQHMSHADLNYDGP